MFILRLLGRLSSVNSRFEIEIYFVEDRTRIGVTRTEWKREVTKKIKTYTCITSHDSFSYKSHFIIQESLLHNDLCAYMLRNNTCISVFYLNYQPIRHSNDLSNMAAVGQCL